MCFDYMKDLIGITELDEIKTYIETKENVKVTLRRAKTDECWKQGHPPHYDIGTGQAECDYSSSTLKTTGFKGGEFVFLDENDNEIDVIDTAEHYNKTLIFDVSHKHKVNPHYDGDRVVDIYFWVITT